MSVGEEFGSGQSNQPTSRWRKELSHLSLLNPSVTIWEQDSELRYLWIYNPQFPESEVFSIGKRDLDLIPEREEAERVEALKRSVLQTGIGRHEEVSILYKGKRYYYYLVIEPIVDEDGRITGIRCASADITTHKEAEAALERSIQMTRLQHEAARYLGETLDPVQVYDRFHELLTAVVPHDGLVVSAYDSESGIIRCDYAWTDGVKLDPATLPALPLNPDGEGMQSRVIRSGESLLINDVVQRVQNAEGTFYQVDGQGNLQKIPEGGEPEVQAAIMTPIKLQGTVMGVVQVMNDKAPYTEEQLEIVEAIVAQMSAAARNAKLYQAAQHEIAERRKVEQALRESEERFRAFTNSIPAAAWTAAPDGTITYTNEQWLAYTGLTPEENARDWAELVLHPDDYERCVAEWTHALQEGTDYQIEVRNRRFDGEYRWFLTQAIPVRDSEGKITAWYGTTTDIHDRKQTEQNLQFLFDLGTQMREIDEPEELLGRAVQMVGDYMALTRCYFGEIDEERGQLRVIRDYHPMRPPLAGDYSLASFNPALLDMLQRGQTLVTNNTRLDTLTAASYDSHYGPTGIVARVGVPLLREGKLAGTLWASKDQPYTWSKQEINLLETVAARIWLAYEKARLNDELRASEERFRLASRAVAGLVYDWQIETGKMYYSEGVEQVTGVSLGDVSPTLEWLRARTHPEDHQFLTEQTAAILQSTAEGYEFEYRVWHEDGYWVTLWDRGYIIRDEEGTPVRVVGSATDITQRKQAEEERERLLAALDYERGQLKGLNESLEQQIQLRTTQVRQLASALTLTEQQERRLLARELHDSAGQLLTALQIYIKLIMQEIPQELEEVHEKMEEAVKMVQDAQQEVRAISHAMRPPALDQLGLKVALEELCHDFTRRTGIQVNYQIASLPTLDEQISLNFYRFLQEALNNVAKHSRAEAVEVAMGHVDGDEDGKEGELILVVEDNGIGFDVPTVLASTSTSRGMGLQSLQERFYLFGGQVEITSQLGQGTRLTARRPIGQAA